MRKILPTLFFLLVSHLVSAATWYVRSGGTGNGTTSTTAFGTINAAITAASSGDIIDIGPGTFAERLRITKSLELKGNNAGVAPWNWSNPATTLLPPTTNFASALEGSLVYIEANGVVIDGLEFEGVNNSLSDAAPRVINSANSRSGWGIVVPTAAYNTFKFRNNRFRNLTNRGIALGSTDIQNSLVEVKDNAFVNITGVNNVVAFSILATNYLPTITGNRITSSNAGPLLQFSGSANTTGVATVSDNQMETHVIGLAFRGFSNGIAPALLVQNNTITGINYDLWSAEGYTKPTSLEFTGMDFSNLLGDNAIRIEGNTVREARSALYFLNNVKSSTNPDRILVKQNLLLNSNFGVYMDAATTGNSRVVVDGSIVRDGKVTGMQVMGTGTFENDLALRNGVVLEHGPTGLETYTNALYLSGAKAILSELNNTKISSARYNFIVFDNNAMAGKEVDGNNVTYDGTVNGFTFYNYKPSAVKSAALRKAVKERIQDNDQPTFSGSGKVLITVVANSTWYVATGATGNGTSIGNASGTIAAAITAASAGDTIMIGAGTFAERLKINKSLVIKGSNEGTIPANWNLPVTKIIPPSTNFESTVVGSLANIEANNVTIEGIEFDGVNNALSDAAPRVINGASARASWAIAATEGQGNLQILRNKFQNFASRAVVLSSSTLQSAPAVVKDNHFTNITAINNGTAFAVLTTNYVPQVSNNKVLNSNAGILLQYSGVIAPTTKATLVSNEMEVHYLGLAVRGFSGAVAPEHQIASNTVRQANYSTWTAEGLTKPTTNQLDGIDLFQLLGNNTILVENNTVDGALDGILIRTVPKSATNPDRLLLKGNTLTNNDAGVYLVASAGADTRAVVDGGLIRDSKFVALNIQGINTDNTAAQNFNEVVLRNGVVMDHPAPITTDYNEAIYLKGEKAVLAELNNTKISTAKFNFITFASNAMAGKEVDGNNVTYDGIVGGMTFNNYKPSSATNLTLRSAVKDRIQDGDKPNFTGSGIVRISLVAGLQEMEEYASVQVFPNPSSSGFIHIHLSGIKARQVEAALYSLAGQALKTQVGTVSQNKAQLQLSTNRLAKGMYLLKLSDGTAVSTRKVVVE
ncbi:T9SS type A sorting domain-containing protein [Rufibacter soli]